MIIGIIHAGSGLGNQLARYVVTRTLALDKGLDFGMACPNLFKGQSFMKLDMGKPIPFKTHVEYPAGKVVVESDWPLFEEKTSDYNWALKDINDNTIIDGDFQGEKYFEHRRDEINEWLKVEPLDLPDDLCIIGFRGGEYVYVPELFLPFQYWHDAVMQMRKINPNMRFKVVTDDPAMAKIFFPSFEIQHEISSDWRHARYAKYLILANSSFFILPTWLNENKKMVIAPKYWGRYNVEYWCLEQNKYKGWHYLDKKGLIEKYEGENNN